MRARKSLPPELAALVDEAQDEVISILTASGNREAANAAMGKRLHRIRLSCTRRQWRCCLTHLKLKLADAAALMKPYFEANQ